MLFLYLNMHLFLCVCPLQCCLMPLCMGKPNGAELSSVLMWWLSLEPIGVRLCLRPKEPGERRAPPVGGFTLKTTRCEVENRVMTSERRRGWIDAVPIVRFLLNTLIVPIAPFTVHTICTIVVALCAHARCASISRKQAAEWRLLLDHIPIRLLNWSKRKNRVQVRGRCELGSLFGQRES